MERIFKKNSSYTRSTVSLISGLLIGTLITYFLFSITNYYGFGFVLLFSIIASTYYMIKKNKMLSSLEDSLYLFIFGFYFGFVMLIPYFVIIRIWLFQKGSKNTFSTFYNVFLEFFCIDTILWGCYNYLKHISI